MKNNFKKVSVEFNVRNLAPLQLYWVVSNTWATFYMDSSAGFEDDFYYVKRG